MAPGTVQRRVSEGWAHTPGWPQNLVPEVSAVTRSGGVYLGWFLDHGIGVRAGASVVAREVALGRDDAFRGGRSGIDHPVEGTPW